MLHPLPESVRDSNIAFSYSRTEIHHFFQSSESRPSLLPYIKSEMSAAEYDALLAYTPDMLESRLGRWVTIEQAKMVCMSNIGERNLGKVVVLMLRDARF